MNTRIKMALKKIRNEGQIIFCDANVTNHKNN